MTTINILSPFPGPGDSGIKPPLFPQDGSCRNCDTTLMRMQGYTYHWPLVCNNWQCHLYRQPQGIIAKQTNGDDPKVPWYLKFPDRHDDQKARYRDNYAELKAAGATPEFASYHKTDKRTAAYLKKQALKKKRE